MVRDFSELLALWTPTQLSRLLGARLSTVKAMYLRGSIGPAHWSKIIDLSAARGEPVSAHDLLRFRDSKMGKPAAAQPRRRRKSHPEPSVSPVA
jgi:hypothetical protein